MPTNETAGTVFIRENTLLPGGLMIETEAVLPGWRAVKDCDGYRLGRKIEEAKWNFFYLAGDVKVIVLGRQGPESLRKAVQRIQAKPEARRFNSLEITGSRSRWFMGIPFVVVTAKFRHLQQGLALDPANDCTLGKRVTPDKELVENGARNFVPSA
jgi:hypothetical protein